MSGQNNEKLDAVFRQLFPKVEKFNDQTSSQDIREWDSLRHIMLMTELEKVFNIRFSLDDMLSMQNLGDIRELVNRKTAG